MKKCDRLNVFAVPAFRNGVVESATGAITQALSAMYSFTERRPEIFEN